MENSFVLNRIATLSLLIASLGCAHIVSVNPPSSNLVNASVYATDATAASAVSGIYSQMTANVIGGGGRGISALAGLSADEFSLYPSPTDELLSLVYSNSLIKESESPIWNDLYSSIYQANSAIEGISSSTTMSSTSKQQLLGEATFVRAFCYFYLVNFFGDVPLITSASYKSNEGAARSAQAIVYRQIITDLGKAKQLLTDNYLTPAGAMTTERKRPNRFTAQSLLARVYLYTGVYDSAEMEATTVINNGNFYQLVSDLDSVSLANNSEAIWQLEMPNNGFNTRDGSIFLLSVFGGPSAYTPFILSDSLVHQFDTVDLRRKHWIDSIAMNGIVYYFPFKYKQFYTGLPPEEYPAVFRLAEQYLIRAEARAQGGNLDGAMNDLNVIRTRAGIPAISGLNQQDILKAINKQRRLELFTEYGHRWMDLKRSGNIDNVMSTVTPLKGGVWKTTAQLYPIPLGEIKLDANLSQNPGY